MRKVVQAGEQVVVPLFNRWNAGVMVSPGPGATALVEFTFSSKEDVEADAVKQPGAPDSCMWDTWAAGPVTSVSSDVFDASVAALRFSSANGESTFEVRG